MQASYGGEGCHAPCVGSNPATDGKRKKPDTAALPAKRHRCEALSSSVDEEPVEAGEEDSPSALDVCESGREAAALAASRWTCSICCFEYSGDRKPWLLDCCLDQHRFCCSCLRKCLQIKWECPFHGNPVPQLVVCGVSTSSEYYIKAVQSQRARERHLRRCERDRCHGVLERVATGESLQCDVCHQLFCPNPACGKPYSNGHSCEAGFADAACRLDPPVRNCPGCGQASDKVEGCNIVRHATCGTTWCFVCGEATCTWGCTHSTCKARNSDS